MRQFVVIALFLLTIACNNAGCVASNDKQSIQFTDGTVKTVYGLTTDGSVVNYYVSKEDASKGYNKVTVPLTVVKQIVNLKDE